MTYCDTEGMLERAHAPVVDYAVSSNGRTSSRQDEDIGLESQSWRLI